MDESQALSAFAALGQPTRLAVFRLLVKAGPAGLPSGEIGAALDVRQNTMSANLSILLAAGLVKNTRRGRQIVYSANMEGMRNLLAFLMEDCCGGRAEICGPVLDAITCEPGRSP